MSLVTNISALLIASYCMGSISVALNAYVVVYILKMKTKSMTMSCKTILYLHFTQAVYMLASIPNIWETPISLCQFIGWLRYYTGFSNVCASCSINYVIYMLLFGTIGMEYNNSKRSNRYYWLEGFVFGLPLITMLPFITNSYGVNVIEGNSLCSIPPSDPNVEAWDIGILYAWTISILLLQSFLTGLLIFNLLKHYSEVSLKILMMYGLYPIVTLVLWIPRTLGRFTKSGNSSLGITAFSEGIGYFLIFFMFMPIFFKTERDFDIAHSSRDDFTNKTFANSSFAFGSDHGRGTNTSESSNIENPVFQMPRDTEEDADDDRFGQIEIPSTKK